MSDFVPPPEKRRSGSFVVRMALRRIPQRQDPSALKAATRMVLAMPLIQGALLVGVLKAETWMLLLSLEGLLICWLAGSQLSRPSPESKLTGFAIAMMNTVLLGAAGLFLGSNVYWLTGLIGIVPVTMLLFRPTGRSSVKLAWLAYAGPLLILVLAAGLGRWSLIKSETETDPGARQAQLGRAWYALHLRGNNGNERPLLRLRQAQAAFEAGDYSKAYRLADDGLYYADRSMRPVAASLIATDLIDSLVRVKAQSFYNARWGKQDDIYTPIKREPLDEEARNDKQAAIRWGW